MYESELFEKLIFINGKFFQDEEMAELFTTSPQIAKDLYINYLRQKYKDIDMTFKVHFCQIENWPAAQALIEEWNPSIIAIQREDKFAAIKSLAIATRRGYFFKSEKPIKPFIVDQNEFDRWYHIICECWELGIKKYNPAITIIGEKAKDAIIELKVDREFAGGDEVKPQNSQQVAKDLILNLEEIEKWFSWKNKNVC
jgi:hypothetical protein